jgi:hypothetical protein
MITVREGIVVPILRESIQLPTERERERERGCIAPVKRQQGLHGATVGIVEASSLVTQVMQKTMSVML